MDKQILPILDGGFRPTRVIVDSDGMGVPSSRAFTEYKVAPDVIFIREDNWSLGAPSEFESVAFKMWEDYWTHFAYIKTGRWLPITEYN